MDDTLLIFDGSYLMHRICHIPKFMEMDNGGLYGFIKSLRSVVNMYNSRYVIIVFDSGRSKRRQSIYPDYKSNRDPISDDAITERDAYFDIFNDQLSKIIQFTSKLGAHTVQLDCAEGDDILDYITMNHRGNSIIVTDDMDMLTMVSKVRSVYRPMGSELVELDNFEDITGILTPRRYLWFKSIVGDGSDNIAQAAKGVGHGTAKYVVNLMNEFSEKELIRVCRTRNGLRFKLLESGFKSMVRNLALMDTSFESFTSHGILAFDESFSRFNRVSEVNVTRDLMQYEFNSIMDMMPRWIHPFRRLHSFNEAWSDTTPYDLSTAS